MKNEKVNVVVQYVGNDDFVDSVSANTVFQSIKVRAMNKFDLDPDSSDRYVLQYNGSDVTDHSHIGVLELENVTLNLTLKEEVPKG